MVVGGGLRWFLVGGGGGLGFFIVFWISKGYFSNFSL